MKIGVVRQRYTAIGGAERYLNGVVRELAARGHDVHVFANSWQETAGFTFHRVPMMRGASFLKALTFALSARKVVRREKCDLIFSLERTLEQDVYRAGDGCHRRWLRERAKYESPLKTASVRLNPLHWTLCALEKNTFSPQRTARIIANSRQGKREIAEHYQFPNERIEVIYNGVDCDRFRPSNKRRHEKLVSLLFAGTGFERKGLRFCIEALKHLPPHVHLRVVGKGNVAPYLALARREGAEPRVQFCGHNADIASLYHEADILVHPAIYEPFANVCLEAMASGLPVVTSRINGASEIIEHGSSGAIVEDPGNTAALAEAIRPFLDLKFRMLASERARTVAERHPFAQNVEQTLQVLAHVNDSNR